MDREPDIPGKNPLQSRTTTADKANVSLGIFAGSQMAMPTIVFHSRILAAALAAAVTFMTGCGTEEAKKDNKAPENTQTNKTSDNPQDDGNKTSTSDDPKETGDSGSPLVLVFLGGYTSCADSSKSPDNMDLTEMFKQIFDDVTAKNGGQEPSWFLSCYGFDPDTATYMNSADPDKKLTRSVASMEKDLAAFALSLGKPELYVAGHSYGAYTALKLLPGLATEIKVKALVTIDAISKVGCTPEGALPAVLGAGAAPQGCLEAPTDITKEQQEKIKAQAGTWLNFYQTDSQILHSGPFAPAQNEKRTYDSGGFAPHNDLVFDDDVISAVSAAILKSAGFSLTDD
jgi:pimeloyl-ACP methyl ester carboxylesterase